MSERRLLVIDPDGEFHDTLNNQLSPYGFVIYPAEVEEDVLSQVDSVSPELIFIAVDEPDKIGYSLCSKAKKGVARDIPIVLTTSTVPQKGFNGHRRLKVHADEYIDKRDMTIEDLLAKVNSLVGLGELPDEELEIPMDVEELSLDGSVELIDDSDVQVEPDIEAPVEVAPSAVAAEGVGTDTDGGEPPDQDALHDETDAAFAAIGMGMPEPPSFASTPDATTQVGESPAFHVEGEEAEAIDLGLDVVAEQAAEQASEASGEDPAVLVDKVRRLEDDKKRLSGQIEKLEAEVSSQGGTGGFAREREFLDLRELLNKKEREVIDLRQVIDDKDAEVLAGHSRVRQLELTIAQKDADHLKLEQRILEVQESKAKVEEYNQKANEEFESEMTGLRRNIDELKKDQVSKLEQAQKDLDATVAEVREELQAQHERSLGQALARHQREQETALDERVASEKALTEKYENEISELKKVHSAAIAELEAERDQLTEALETERSNLRKLEDSKAVVVADLEQANSDKADRDNKIGELKQTIVGLEQVKRGHEEQVLTAYKKIRGDEETVDKAKKALAIALTYLDEEIVKLAAPEPIETDS